MVFAVLEDLVKSKMVMLRPMSDLKSIFGQICSTHLLENIASDVGKRDGSVDITNVCRVRASSS